MALHSRRDVLGLGSVAAATALAGCTDWQFARRPDLTLDLINRYPNPVEFHVELLRADGNERSEARVLNEWYELPGRDEESGRVSDENAVPSRPYLVRVAARDTSGRHIDQAHYHFLPDCTGGDHPPERLLIALSANENVEGAAYFVEFTQSYCSTDAVIL
ncbi:hypothetical protein SAMN04487949_1655 [Halogranum gelatinilyticum]|uniref:Uncharacterized protein n=1 Tax=Halogranum gelatinilyticum TaxID=660521 RepID=A0A1G9T7U6_9EURY|nr:twin-arginine translocation signal domain-containing protein [Halogranum gelatinilyticum]SDM43700.1 hypothetical protein SAMN04487949_1655 [Halogranum gelatinilyticum]